MCPEFKGGGPKARKSVADTVCPHWLEVADEPLTRSAPWEAWLRVQAANSLAPENFSLAYDSFFRGMPYQLDNGTLAPDGFVPLPATSSCSGAEDDLRQCFWAQLTDRLQKNASATQPTARPCRWKIVVGCTDEHSDAAPRAAAEAAAAAAAAAAKAAEALAAAAAAAAAADFAAAAAAAATAATAAEAAKAAAAAAAAAAHKDGDGDGYTEDGVFVLGDIPRDDFNDGVFQNFFRPKIFTHFDGPYNCRTGACARLLSLARAPVCVCVCVAGWLAG